jgi:outer membrane protein TolC
MQTDRSQRPSWVPFLLIASALLIASGCSRSKYRLQADRDAYATIAERNLDPRWSAMDFGIELDPRSRFFDSYDPDKSPMPQDDPTSHQYMDSVHGMSGWEHWHDNGERDGHENPGWREAMQQYVAVTDDGSVTLNVESAIKLAYIHSPSYQNQLETLYLSALDVTAERFRLDTQYFGGYDAIYGHNGSLIPAGLNRPPMNGQESNRITLGKSPALQARQRFATAGEVLVGFANSFVFEFSGNNSNLAASLANFSLVQPLLRGAGKNIALEQLTLVERSLLANLRAHSQYRQGFYTQVVIGEQGVSGPQRGGPGTSFSGVGGGGGVGGYLGLLQQLQRIRNTEDNLSAQLRTLEQLEALLDVGVIDLVQVDQFRQSVESERSSLLQSQNSLKLSLDFYKTNTLGLPPDLLIALDDTMIRQFQLVPREATAVEDTIIDLQDEIGVLPEDASLEQINTIMAKAAGLVTPIQSQLDTIAFDIEQMKEAVPKREETMSEEEKSTFQQDRQQLVTTLSDLEAGFEKATSDLNGIQDGLSEDTRPATETAVVVWLGDILRLLRRSLLIQARARLETVTVDTIGLATASAFEIALANRLDIMNAQAALVDSWRAIEFSANALESVLNVTASGDLSTARNNPVSFRAPTGSLRLGLEFDAPFTRLLERNAYRETLIRYQQNRRTFIQSRDSVHLGLRALLRDIEQLRLNLEIQRRSVAIAIRRVDLTRASLYAPVAPPQPGQPVAPFGPTSARNLIEALAALRTTQNTFMSAWLSYYATRMRLVRELGIMSINEEGGWIDIPVPDSMNIQPSNDNSPAAGTSYLLPPIPAG